MAPRKNTDVVSEEVRQGKPMDLSEIGQEGVIDQVSELHFGHDQIELEAFMNEILTINVHPGPKGSLKTVTPNVNGINQPIIRGANSKVKRKYVEALARTRTETYTQRQANPSDRASLQMVPESIIDYPFSVIHDPNDKGRAWLEGIIKE